MHHSTGRPLVIVGAGGFAREVRWLARDAAEAGISVWNPIGFVVSDLGAVGDHDDAQNTLGDFEWLEESRHEIEGLALGIGSPQVRLRLGRELRSRFPEIEWPPLIHPTVTMDRQSCEVGEGAILCAGTIATVGVVVARFAAINLACTLGHEAVIGEGSVLNPTVNISGGVTIGPGVLIGTGAQILQYRTVAANATVGAGAVVTKNVPADTTVVGVPAKPLQ